MKLAEFLARLFGQRSADVVTGIDAGQWPHAVPAVFNTQFAKKREFHIRPAANFFLYIVKITGGVELVFIDVSVFIFDADVAVIQFEGAVSIDET